MNVQARKFDTILLLLFHHHHHHLLLLLLLLLVHLGSHYTSSTIFRHEMTATSHTDYAIRTDRYGSVSYPNIAYRQSCKYIISLHVHGPKRNLEGRPFTDFKPLNSYGVSRRRRQKFLAPAGYRQISPLIRLNMPGNHVCVGL